MVLMGVSGSGKSTVGPILAALLGVEFIDGDGLHPPANVAKMHAGIPLTDEDRWPWLSKVGRTLHGAEAIGLVIACSALKRIYRDAIRAEEPNAIFVLLTGSRAVIDSRLKARTGHFMPSSLLTSQLQTLEPLQPDERGAAVDVGDSAQRIAATAASDIRSLLAGG